MYVADLLADVETILSQPDIEKKYSLKINSLHYYRRKILIVILLNKQQYLERDFTTLYGTKGCFKKLNETTIEVSFKNKWQDDRISVFNNANWQNYFRIHLKVYKDLFHKWFQYRILHCILRTQNLLHKVGISNSLICLACHSEVKSLIHLFYYCCGNN